MYFILGEVQGRWRRNVFDLIYPDLVRPKILICHPIGLELARAL